MTRRVLIEPVCLIKH